MITEDRMRALLESAASELDAPSGGPARVLAAGRTTETVGSPPRNSRVPKFSMRGLAVAGAVAVVFVASGLAVTDGAEDRLASRSVAGDLQGDGGSANAGAGSVIQQYASGRYATTVPASGASVGGSTSAGDTVVQQNTKGSAGQPAGDLSKVVRTGSLTIEVATSRFDEAVQAITTLATGAGGLVSDSQASSNEDHRSGSVTVRVPANRFDAVVADLRRLGPVTRSETAADDITAEYTDVEARLKALDTTRTAILAVLSEAKTVGDILAVQDRLNAVQTEIEQLQGRRRVLDDQVSLATVSVQLVEPGATTVATEPVRSSWDKAVDGFTGTWAAVLAKSGTALAAVLLVATLLGLAVLVTRTTRRAVARLLV